MTTPFYKRRGLWAVAAVLAVPVLAVAWYLLSPLFFDTEVNEDFPFAVTAELPAGMEIAEAEAEMEKAAIVEDTAEEPMTDEMETAVILATGAFQDVDSVHQGSGTATFYELTDGSRVLRLENLDVTNGPDLHVYISPVASPATSDEVGAAGSETLGRLKGNLGNQTYEVPAGYKIPLDGSVVVYCKRFHVLFSIATLSAAA